MLSFSALSLSSLTLSLFLGSVAKRVFGEDKEQRERSWGETTTSPLCVSKFQNLCLGIYWPQIHTCFFVWKLPFNSAKWIYCAHSNEKKKKLYEFWCRNFVTILRGMVEMVKRKVTDQCKNDKISITIG